MRSKRYLKDYQLTPEVNAKGRLLTVASYTGSYHRFTAEKDALSRARWTYLILMLAALVFFILQLWYTNLFDRDKRYLVLPMSFNVLPAFGVVLGVIRFLVAPSQMTLRQRDQICNRLPASSFCFFLFALLAFAATVVHLIDSGFLLSAGLYCADALALMLLSLWIFSLRGILRTEVIPD